MANVFISYRREDSSAYAGRIYDWILKNIPADRVFMDIDSIKPGDDFVEVIENVLVRCQVVIVIIGPKWISCAGRDGRKRLDNPGDFHRLEIEAAIRHRVRIIPVLVGGAEMPAMDSLPDTIQVLARRNAVEISDKRFRHDVEMVLAAISRLPDAEPHATKPLPEYASPAISLPEPSPLQVQPVETAPSSSEPFAASVPLAPSEPQSILPPPPPPSPSRTHNSLLGELKTFFANYWLAIAISGPILAFGFIMKFAAVGDTPVYDSARVKVNAGAVGRTPAFPSDPETIGLAGTTVAVIKPLVDSVRVVVVRSGKKDLYTDLRIGKQLKVSHIDTIIVYTGERGTVEVTVAGRTVIPKRDKFKIFESSVKSF